MTGTIPPFAVRVSRERKRPGALPADGTSGRTAAAAEAVTLHNGIVPALPLGLPFVRTAVSADGLDWAEFLRRHDQTFTLFYVDPLYWRHEDGYGGLFARKSFEKLADVLASFRGRFILSTLNDRPETRRADH